MDRFITKTPKVSRIFDDATTAVCLWGPYGCGKTTWVREQFPGILEIDYDDPVEFMSRVDHRWILVDNFDALDSKVFSQWFTRPKTIYVNPKPIEGLWNHEHANKKSLRGLFGIRDIHMDPKDYLIEQMSRDQDHGALDAINKCGAEHGNGIGLVFENFPKVCTIEESVELLESLSFASVIDQRIYRGQWNYETLKYFNFFAFSVPLRIIKGRLKEPAASATIWSKFLNECMKRKKLRESGLDHETIEVARAYALREENPLGLTDLDTLKIGDLTGRLKQKTIQKLKKNARGGRASAEHRGARQ